MKRRNAPQAPFKSDGNKLGKARFGAGLSREPRMPRGQRHDGPGDLRKRTVNARRVTRKRPMNKFDTTTLYEENKPGPTMHERSSSTTHAGLDICRLLQVPGRALSLTSARCACIKTRGVLDPRRLSGDAQLLLSLDATSVLFGLPHEKTKEGRIHDRTPKLMGGKSRRGGLLSFRLSPKGRCQHRSKLDANRRRRTFTRRVSETGRDLCRSHWLNSQV